MGKTQKLHNANYTKFTAWNSTCLSIEEIKQPDSTLKPEIKHSEKGKIGVKSNYSVLTQGRLTSTLKNNNKGVCMFYDLKRLVNLS